MWPLGGWSFGTEPLPTLHRGLVLKVLMELAGAGALAWQIARFRLLEPANRARFLHEGRLVRCPECGLKLHGRVGQLYTFVAASG